MLTLPRHTLWLLLIALTTAIALPAAAHADLRNPHLTSSCNQGRTYAEDTFGPWQVEGCSESATPKNGETKRTLYYGDVELNGMIVESPGGGDAPLTATIKPGDGQHVNRIQRTGAKLVLDPKIAGSRRRMVIYSGNGDLKITTDAGNDVDTSVPPHKHHVAGASTVAPPGTIGTVDIPVSGTPS